MARHKTAGTHTPVPSFQRIREGHMDTFGPAKDSHASHTPYKCKSASSESYKLGMRSGPENHKFLPNTCRLKFHPHPRRRSAEISELYTTTHTIHSSSNALHLQIAAGSMPQRSARCI